MIWMAASDHSIIQVQIAAKDLLRFMAPQQPRAALMSIVLVIIEGNAGNWGLG